VLIFHACFQNARIIRVHVVASVFGMPSYRGADIPIRSRLVLNPPRLPTSFTLSNLHGHVLQLTLCTILFNRSFVDRSLGFLKTSPNVVSCLKAVLMFSRFKIRLIRCDTPFTYRIDAYGFGYSGGFGCVLFG